MAETTPPSKRKRRRAGGQTSRGGSSAATRGAFHLVVLSCQEGTSIFHLPKQSSRRVLHAWWPIAEDATDVDKHVRTIPNLVTMVPAPAKPIDPRPVAETGELLCYTDLFLRGAHAVRTLLDCVRRDGERETAAFLANSGAPQDSATRRRNSYVIPTSAYTQLAMAVFKAGHHFTIDAAGRPHVSVHGGSAPTAMDVEAIKSGAVLAGVTDLDALHGLEFGFSLACGPQQPHDCIYVSNSPEVLANAAAMDEIISSEE